MATQLGMAMGVLFLLPLGDGCERRRMLTFLAIGMTASCLGVVAASTFGWLLISWWALGIVALIPSLLPPFLVAFTPESLRGRMLGGLLSGHFSGILLSRSLSGLLAQLWGWRSIYLLSATAMLGVALLFRYRLPALPRTSQESYWQLQISLWSLWHHHPRLRRSCLTQGILFGCFMALWSALALHLGDTPWRFGPAVIGSFGLVGIASILAAPKIGLMVDRLGSNQIVLLGALCTGIGVTLLGLMPTELWAIVAGLMVVDLGVQGSFIANQARIFSIDPAASSRMSSLLFLSTYLSAAICSLVISIYWTSWGWNGTCMFTITLVVIALVIEFKEWLTRGIHNS